MSYFSGRNVDDIPDNPNELPNNTYLFQVTSAKAGPTKDKSKEGITFKYQIVEGSFSTFFPINDWTRTPDKNTKDDEIDRMLSFLKMRLIAFGFTPDEIENFGPDQVNNCIGKFFYGTTSLRKENNMTNIRVTKFDPVGDGAGSATEVDFGDNHPDM